MRRSRGETDISGIGSGLMFSLLFAAVPVVWFSYAWENANNPLLILHNIAHAFSCHVIYGTICLGIGRYCKLPHVFEIYIYIYIVSLLITFFRIEKRGLNTFKSRTLHQMCKPRWAYYGGRQTSLIGLLEWFLDRSLSISLRKSYSRGTWFIIIMSWVQPNISMFKVMPSYY